ncbi:MAG: ATP-dependent DNA helicase RecQ [Polyangiaceae bacterium]
MRAVAPPSRDPLTDVLRERFGIDGFRPWQREAVEAILGSPGRALVIAPTGGGKSLTYQFPAAVLEGTTLVISPLIALMEDQVRALTARGVPATFLASSLEPSERQARERDVLRGRYKLIYAAPERLAYDGFVGLLTKARIELVAIDEAHCISHWGHDFRPDYLRIGALLERIRPRRVLACTATATPHVRQEIVRLLGLDKGEFVEILRGFARPNLHLAALNVEGPKSAKKALSQALSVALGEPRKPKGGAIVYAATRRSTEQWSDTLLSLGWNATHYHAGLEPDTRSRVSDRFASRKVDIVVATNAFGMGIDRSDIRTVVHVQPPSSIEAYYQEVGRAGRDGAEAYGLLLCSGADIAVRRRLVEMGSEGVAADPAMVAKAWGLFRDLLRYLDARSCRHDFILRYFGDEQELLGGCGHCDVCEALDGSESEPESVAEREARDLLVRKALSGVARAQRRAGLAAIAEMLVGADNERIRRFRFNLLSTYGLLKDRSEDWVMALLRAMLAAGWIDLTPSEHPVPYITRSGVEVMRGEAPARIVLPASARQRTKKDARSVDSTGVPLSVSDMQLFEKLRAHRAELARTRSVPSYVIALDRTLNEMASARPKTRAALLKIHGMGPARVETYGDGFLDIIANHV